MRLKDDLVYIGHMLDITRKISDKVSGLTREAFDDDEDLRFALAHLVQVIEEAARCISEDGKLKFDKIPWREIIGMRNKIVHDYMDVSFEVLWAVVTSDIPPLLSELEKIAPPFKDESAQFMDLKVIVEGRSFLFIRLLSYFFRHRMEVRECFSLSFSAGDLGRGLDRRECPGIGSTCSQQGH